MKRILLALLRIVDKTAYECRGCLRIKRGIAERDHDGWVCGETCRAWAYWRRACVRLGVKT